MKDNGLAIAPDKDNARTYLVAKRTFSQIAYAIC